MTYDVWGKQWIYDARNFCHQGPSSDALSCYSGVDLFLVDVTTYSSASLHYVPFIFDSIRLWLMGSRKPTTPAKRLVPHLAISNPQSSCSPQSSYDGQCRCSNSRVGIIPILVKIARHDLQIISERVGHKGCVVERCVLWSQPGFSTILRSGFDSGGVEILHLLLVYNANHIEVLAIWMRGAGEKEHGERYEGEE